MSDDSLNLVGALLQSLSPDEVARVSGYGSHQSFAAGDVMAREGETMDVVYVIESGRAEVTVLGPRAEPRAVATLGRGDAIGEMGLLTGNRASASVTAVTPVSVVAFSHADIDRVLAAFPAVERALGRVVAQRLARAQRRLVGQDARVVLVVSGPSTDGQLTALAASAAWHGRRPVLALTPGGTVTHADLVREWTQGPHEPIGEVTAVDDAVFSSLPQLAGDLAGAVAALVALVPAEATPGGTAGSTVAGIVSELPTIEPSRTDAEDVERGTLPPASRYGAALGPYGRLVAGRRVGIAFGAGSPRGFAHAGVMDVLTGAGVPVDAVAGTSIGSAAACLVAMGRDGDAIVGTLERAGAVVVRPHLAKSSLFSARLLTRYFDELVGDRLIESLPIPTGIVAADLDTGEEIVFRRGRLATAVMASIAIPGVYPPQHVSGRRLVDGACVNPVPADVVASLGADVVIAIKLTTRTRRRVEVEAVPGTGQQPWAPQVILRSVDMMSNAVARALPANATVVIEPTFAGAGGSLGDFKRGGAKFRAEGRRAAEAVLPDLLAQLPWLTGAPSAR